MDQHHQQKSMISPGYGGGDYDYPAADLDQAHQLIALQAGNPDAWRGFYQDPRENFGVVDDSSMRCLFPADASQGLSLSLYNADQSTAAAAGVSLAESFSHQLTTNPHDDYIPKPAHLRHDTRFFASTASPPESPYQQPERHVTACKYLIPAQELLNEFCSLGGSTKMKPVKQNKWEERGSSSFNQSLSSMDLIELQKRKAKLLSMLEEVDMRYRKYKEQTKAVVSTFEGVVGEGSATVYLDMASKAMSRHFRCLRDAIVAQVQETKKAMGEKDTGVAGATRGQTPRLRLLDQCLRQQKAFNQVGVMGNQPWRPQRGLPEHSVSVLRAWLFEHFLHPYPSDVDKHILARQTGLSRSQVSNWFINARVRLWKPMVEEMYVEETKEHDYQSSHATVANEEDNNSQLRAELKQNPNPNFNPSCSQERDEKPAQVQLRNDSESLASVINHGGHRLNGRNPLHGNGHQAENFGAVMDLDFSSYNGYGGQSFGVGGGGSGVSLTLGLQQHDGGGMSLSFSPGSQQSLYFSRENMDECPPVQFSVVVGEAQCAFQEPDGSSDTA